MIPVRKLLEQKCPFIVITALWQQDVISHVNLQLNCTDNICDDNDDDDDDDNNNNNNNNNNNTDVAQVDASGSTSDVVSGADYSLGPGDYLDTGASWSSSLLS
jgi:hypothetical protein